MPVNSRWMWWPPPPSPCVPPQNSSESWPTQEPSWSRYQSHAQPSHFGQTPGHKQSFGVVPVAHAVTAPSAERYYAANNARTLAQKAGVEMPIAQAAYEVLYEGRDVHAVITDLMHSVRHKFQCQFYHRWCIPGIAGS